MLVCQSLFIKKETLAQVISCEFCEISVNTFFYRTPLVAASVYNPSFSFNLYDKCQSYMIRSLPLLQSLNNIHSHEKKCYFFENLY